MKMFFSLFILISITSQLYSVDFRDDTNKVNVKFSDTIWEHVNKGRTKSRLTLRHLTIPATVNIVTFRFSETITANGLVQKRIQSVYDGWELVNQQTISELHAKQKNISEGIRSIYRKSYLNKDLKTQYKIAGDICLVTDETLGIILNVTVDKPETLLEIKPEFNKIYTSLWYGDTKPNVNFVINNDQEWVMGQQNLARRRLYQSKFVYSPQVKLLNKININRIPQPDKIKTYFNSNGDYILSGNDLSIIHPVLMNSKSLRINLNQPELILIQDGFLAVQNEPRMKVIKYNNEFNITHVYEDNQKASQVFFVNDHLVAILDQEIKLFKENNIIWSFRHNYDIDNVVALKDRLIIADNKDSFVRVLDLNKGELLNEVKIGLTPYEKFNDMAISNGKLYVITEENTNVTHTIINMDGFKIEDQITQQYRDFELLSITKDLIIIKYIDNQGKMTMEALDFVTFASLWKIPFENYRQRVVTPRQIIAINDANQMVSFELKSAKKRESLNLKSLLNPTIENKPNVNVIKIIPLKKKLLAIIEQESQNKAIYLR